MKKILALVFVLMMTLFGSVEIMPAYAEEEAEELTAENAASQIVSENEAAVAEKSVSENGADDSAEADISGSQSAVDLGLSAPSYLLMEASTGTVILSNNENEVLRPASITKVMTMILIFDALKEGKLKLEEEVTVSEYASSMGGSQVFLEAGEKQTVETMLKCIAVASANDACAS